MIADIDRDRDGRLSPDEQRAYQQVVMQALALDVDGTPAPPASRSRPGFPSLDAIRAGRRHDPAPHRARSLPPLSAGSHHLSFRNRHHPDRSVYLANALVPDSRLITITAQRRDRDQTELTIDYELRPSWVTTASASAMAALAFLVVSVLLIRLARPIPVWPSTRRRALSGTP